jgi:hypothetical protein
VRQSRIECRDAGRVDHVVNLERIESEKTADLHIRDPTLGQESPDIAHSHAEPYSNSDAVDQALAA